jgi:plastocyanin
MSRFASFRRLSHVAAAAVAALLLLAACNGETDETVEDPPVEAGTEDDTGVADPDEGAEAEETDAVAAVDNEFEPAANQVAVGDTVTWTNEGEEQHNVIFEDGEESDLMDTGDTYERTFDEAGEFPYVCTLHPGMEGTVTVTE